MKIIKLLLKIFSCEVGPHWMDFPMAPDQVRKKAEQDKKLNALRSTMPKW